jgi:ATP-dependent DNA helicase RecG
LNELQEWMRSPESEHLEFKEAKQNFHFEKLVKYCAALANEGGGRIVLGVTDKRPRRVVGSTAFQDLARTKAGLIERLHLRIEAEELPHPDGRVLVFTVPSRPLGMPIPVEGAYWMRSGEDLAPMTPDMLKRIFDEAEPDFSAGICSQATLGDLDPAAITAFRQRWIAHSGKHGLANRSPKQLLQDAELVTAKGVTYAALILLGTREALGQYLAQAEVIFEYRSTPVPGPANQREEFRQGFLLFYDRIWELVNLRNDTQHFQYGMIMYPIPTFSEASVREALLNAVSHRDYRHPGSVFVRQYPRRVEIVSPGGFPPGITPRNILDQQAPRNRRIAETFARLGLVERAGQGVDQMFRESIRHAKALPDYGRSDAWQVWLTLAGEIQDVNFLRFLERIGQPHVDRLDTHDLLILGLVARGLKVAKDLRPRAVHLVDAGVLERISGGKFILSRKYYEFVGQKGVYTRKKGLDRQTNKELLLRHLRENADAGSRLAELMQVLPDLSRDQVQGILAELRSERRAHKKGTTRAALWYPGPEPEIAPT